MYGNLVNRIREAEDVAEPPTSSLGLVLSISLRSTNAAIF